MHARNVVPLQTGIVFVMFLAAGRIQPSVRWQVSCGGLKHPWNDWEGLGITPLFRFKE